jgi:hypothetical protein
VGEDIWAERTFWVSLFAAVAGAILVWGLFDDTRRRREAQSKLVSWFESESSVGVPHGEGRRRDTRSMGIRNDSSGWAAGCELTVTLTCDAQYNPVLSDGVLGPKDIPPHTVVQQNFYVAVDQITNGVAAPHSLSFSLTFKDADGRRWRRDESDQLHRVRRG